MEEFIIVLLAEVMLDLAVVGWFVSFTRRTKLHWYFIIFLIILSPFYLYQKTISFYMELPVTLLLIFLELILFYRLIKIVGFRNGEKLKIYDIIPDANIEEMFKAIDKIITIAFPLALPIVIGEFLIFPDILKIPASILSSLILLVLFVKYLISNILWKDNLNRLRNSISTFLQLILLYSIMLFVLSLTYLYTYTSLGLFGASIFAAMILGCPDVLASEFVLKAIGSTVLKNKERDLSEEFIKLMTIFSHLEIILLVALSDIPMVYLFMSAQNLDLLIYWTPGFAFGLIWMYSEIFAKITNFKIKASLETNDDVNSQINKLEDIYFISKFKKAYNSSWNLRRLIKFPSIMIAFIMLEFVFKIQLDVLSSLAIGFVIALILDIIFYEKSTTIKNNRIKS